MNLVKNVQYLMSFAPEPANNFHTSKSSSRCFKETEKEGNLRKMGK